jgi:general secretion pathway protein L
MDETLIVIAAPAPGQQPRWLRIVDGRIVQRGRGTDWPRSDDEPAPRDALIILPPDHTSLHWIACPDMTARQGEAAARLMALDASIGDADTLHAASDGNDDPARPHLVAVTSRSTLQSWQDWAEAEGLSDAMLVPAALVLPEPDDGFVRGTIGDFDVLRGVDAALLAHDPALPLLIKGARVQQLSPAALDARFVAMADEGPPLNLRQGQFARKSAPMFAAGRLRRIALLAGLSLAASLLIALVQIVRLNAAASAVESAALEQARPVVPQAVDAADAQLRLDAMLAQRGGATGFTGMMAGVMTAMQASPAVSLTTASQLADGTLRVQLAAQRPEEINVVLLALQEAGWRISANAVQQQGGRLVADITVVRT